MKANLNFEDNNTKNLLARLDFEFFLKQNINEEKYNQKDIDNLYTSYKDTSLQIKNRAKQDRNQFNLYSEGQVRKMFTGGLLPSLFGLDESRSNRIIDFPAIGLNWAYFEHWQKYQKRKITKEKIWSWIVKIGSTLGIILSIIKLFETYKSH